MTNKKSTKKALLTSTLCLLLCMSMLVGTTFAWFTDSVSSNNNLITAGNLDVELEYAKVENGTLGEFKTVKNATDVFDPNALWEPGRVEVVYLKVSNLGSLELKYQLGVNVYSETPGTNVAGETFKLSEHLVFKPVEMPDGMTTYTDREAVEAAAGTEMGLVDYNGKTTRLEVGGVDYVALIVYMPEKVGNEANYRGTDIPQITLGINLFATQQMAEQDSFGDDYDENAWNDGMKIYEDADLIAALANGEDVVLMNDIATDVVVEITEDVSINLNGKTLTSNLAIAKDAEVVIANGKLVTANGDYSAIETVGNLTLNDVEVESARHGVRVEGGVTIINDGYYKAAGTAGRTQHALNVSDGGKVIVNGGIFVGPAGTASDSGSAVNVQAGSEVIINGGTFSGGKLKTLSVDGTLTVYGGTFDQDPTAYMAKGYTNDQAADGTYTVYFPQASFDALLDNAKPGDTIEVPTGTYTFPASKLQAGQTLNCAPGTVFKGTSKLNIKGATVVGATFSNPSGTAADQTINGIFKNCTFTGRNGLRYCYAGETVVFENCVFDGSVYGIHFDGGANDVLFKNCTISGFNTMGGAVTKLTMEGCTFKSTGRSGYNGINLWGNTEMKDCTFVFDGKSGTEWVDVVNDNKTVTFTNCVVDDGTTEKSVETFIGIYGEGNTVLVDGTYVVATADTLKAALSSEAENVAIILAKNTSVDIGTGWKMGGVNTKSITINGNGKKLTLSSTYRSYFNLANDNGVLNLKNMTLTNLHKGTHFFDYTTHFNCDVVAENVVFAKSPLVSGGAKAVFNDCEFDQAGTDIYGLWVMSGSDVTVNGGELKTDRGFKIADEDSAKELTKLSVSDTKFNNSKKAAILVTTDHGAEITLSNLDISNCGADSINAVWIDDGRVGTADKITVTGGSVIVEH